MTEDVLEKLKQIDMTVLTHVVRQVQRSPSFEITEWSVRRLNDGGIMNPDGLWLLTGWGDDSRGSQSWSVVLKALQRQQEEPAPSDVWYWKRELLLTQSGLLERLP